MINHTLLSLTIILEIKKVFIIHKDAFESIMLYYFIIQKYRNIIQLFKTQAISLIYVFLTCIINFSL